jgi:hypothetical protein
VPQCRNADIDPATGACSNHTKHIQNNNAAGLDAATVNPETFPMQVLDFHCFKAYGQIVQHETLRAERSKMLVDSRGLDRKGSFLFFVSHQWLTSGTALNVSIRSGEHAQGEGSLANYPPKGAWPADEPAKAFEVLLKGGAKQAVQILGKDLIRETWMLCSLPCPFPRCLPRSLAPSLARSLPLPLLLWPLLGLSCSSPSLPFSLSPLLGSIAEHEKHDHPDLPNKGHPKHKLIVQCVDKLLQSPALKGKKVYLWVDFSCMPQDGSAAGSAAFCSLASYTERMDGLITPIVDDEDDQW